MRAMTVLPTYRLFYLLYSKVIGCASMGMTWVLVVDQLWVSVSKWHHACWNSMKRVFLHEPPELWQSFQFCDSFICTTEKKSASLVWVRWGHGHGAVVRGCVDMAPCLLKQHENSFHARTMTAMTFLPTYRRFYLLYSKGIGCASMGKTRSWWWISCELPSRAALCLLKQHENSFHARTMTAMTILPTYKLFYFLYRKGIGCTSMGKTRSWWWICGTCLCQHGTMPVETTWK